MSNVSIDVDVDVSCKKGSNVGNLIHSILNLYRVHFYATVDYGLGWDFLFKSFPAWCGMVHFLWMHLESLNHLNSWVSTFVS